MFKRFFKSAMYSPKGHFLSVFFPKECLMQKVSESIVQNVPLVEFCSNGIAQDMFFYGKGLNNYENRRMSNL
jgi:hypothetical protein